jgi:hypothetical protein
MSVLRWWLAAYDCNKESEYNSNDCAADDAVTHMMDDDFRFERVVVLLHSGNDRKNANQSTKKCSKRHLT